MHNFMPWSALAGGLMIGLAAVLLWWFNGRIAGITGILANVLQKQESEPRWSMGAQVDSWGACLFGPWLQQ